MSGAMGWSGLRTRRRAPRATATEATSGAPVPGEGWVACEKNLRHAAVLTTQPHDTATATDPDLYAERLSASLALGREGFIGRVVARDPAHPAGVPDEYVMRPFDVKLSYAGKPWCTVPLEVGGNEVGDAESADWTELRDVSEAFGAMGFPPPGPVPLMPLAHQVAQKIHAVTGGGDRVRDLIDLQLIVGRSELALDEVRRACVRLFSYRRAQEWPPTVACQEGWGRAYAEQASGLPVRGSVEEAVEWANELIDAIDGAGDATG